MSVHVDEIHTNVSAATPGQDGAHRAADQVTGPAARPGASDDSWRRTEYQVTRLRRRVAAEDFDD